MNDRSNEVVKLQAAVERCHERLDKCIAEVVKLRLRLEKADAEIERLKKENRK